MSASSSWLQEMEGVYLYRALAEAEPSQDRRALFAKLAKEAEAQAAIWSSEAARTSQPLPQPFKPSARLRVVAALARRLGPVRLRPVLAAMKVRGLSIYGSSAPEGGHAMPTSAEEVGRRHRVLPRAANLRAAVFGVNDGLVSNASLILGVAGATSAGGRRGRACRRDLGDRGATRGRLLDGLGRVHLGTLAARDARAPDRGRARRARAVSDPGGGRALPHLSSARSAPGRRPAHGRANHREPRVRARRAGTRGARPRPGGARRPRGAPPAASFLSFGDRRGRSARALPRLARTAGALPASAARHHRPPPSSAWAPAISSLLAGQAAPRAAGSRMLAHGRGRPPCRHLPRSVAPLGRPDRGPWEGPLAPASEADLRSCAGAAERQNEKPRLLRTRS